MRARRTSRPAAFRRSIRLVSQAVIGEPMQSMIAPKVISSPAVPIVTSRPEDSSPSMPAGASTEQPVTKLPSIRAVGAKRWTAGDFPCMHVIEIASN